MSTEPLTIRERSINSDKPFAWQSRNALFRIREKIGGTQAAYALSTYSGLTVLASLAGKQTFDATISVIGTHAGLRYKKTHEMLWMLEDIGLVIIRENKQPGTKANLPHTFTLLAVRSNRRKAVGSNTPDTFCPAGNTSHADSPKELPAKAGELKESNSASPSSSLALPVGSGSDCEARAKVQDSSSSEGGAEKPKRG